MVLQEALCDTPLGLYRIVCTETALYAIERAKGAQTQWEPGPLANRLKGYRSHEDMIELLKPYDELGLLNQESQKLTLEDTVKSGHIFPARAGNLT